MTEIVNHVVYEKFPKGWVVRGVDYPPQIGDEIIIIDQIKGIPVVEIQDNAFFGLAMSKITINAPIRWIGVNAFYDCKNLEKVVLHKQLRNPVVVFDSAFANCERLLHFDVYSQVKLVGEKHFYKCRNLQRLDCSFIERIPAACFCGCTSLYEFKIYNDMIIHQTAFVDSGLTTFVLMNGVVFNLEEIIPFFAQHNVTIRCSANSYAVNAAYSGCKVDLLDDVFNVI